MHLDFVQLKRIKTCRKTTCLNTSESVKKARYCHHIHKIYFHKFREIKKVNISGFITDKKGGWDGYTILHRILYIYFFIFLSWCFIPRKNNHLLGSIFEDADLIGIRNRNLHLESGFGVVTRGFLPLYDQFLPVVPFFFFPSLPSFWPP